MVHGKRSEGAGEPAVPTVWPGLHCGGVRGRHPAPARARAEEGQRRRTSPRPEARVRDVETEAVAKELRAHVRQLAQRLGLMGPLRCTWAWAEVPERTPPSERGFAMMEGGDAGSLRRMSHRAHLDRAEPGQE